MKTIDEQMAIYASYHRDPRNKLTHFFGVPMIVFAILLALSWIRIPLGEASTTGAVIFVAVVLVYYFRLDVALALVTGLFTIILLWLADIASKASFATGLALFLFTFVVGWIIQLVGHYFEGRKPALADNLFQIFVAPIFLAAEVFFALGKKRELHEAVERRVAAMRARAPDGNVATSI